MKYLIAMLAAVTLMGAGCAQSETDVTLESETAVETTQEAETAPEENTQEETTEEPSTDTFMDAAVEVTADAKTTTEVEIEGGSVTINTDVSATEEVEVEDGVPVIDVVLGNPIDVELDMKAGNFFFEPSVIRAGAGERVSVNFTESTGFHTFAIDAIDLDWTISQGEAVVFNAPSEPGEYPFYCSIGSHRSFGMEGTLIVE